MQNSSAKKSHSYRKVDDIERELIPGLTETFKNLAPAIANYIRQSGTKYGELGFYYQGLAYASARKRIYDILKNAAKQGDHCKNETTQQSQSTINISTSDPSLVDTTLPGNNDSTLSAVTSTAIVTSNQPNSLSTVIDSSPIVSTAQNDKPLNSSPSHIVSNAVFTPPRPPASFLKPSTNKNVLTNSQVSFDDNDEEEEILLTVPTKRERPISTFDASGMSDNDDDNILVIKRVLLVTQTTNTLTNFNKLIARFDKCADRFLEENGFDK
ncbi:unnamed protein product [Didymodactylos carnosus]|uniref:Uncharacterized protein n=1 Tax=Didymodactylos carnosus TaxID=1234261 RepID=A0A8S2DD02_9BILA|nr:unnamed protein product [Didymodactylos carnosus]CAF3706558.1 unnamed protein product [Didymodactylos carnosus]